MVSNAIIKSGSKIVSTLYEKVAKKIVFFIYRKFGKLFVVEFVLCAGTFLFFEDLELLAVVFF